jgi:glycosyltransferase involved in cell wall biosynthesis
LNKVVSDFVSVTATPALSKQMAVLIVGMHRSGTSAISGVLSMLGVQPPEDLHPADQHNLKGYFEPTRIIDFHEALFQRLGSPSNDPLPVGYDWVDSPVGEAAVAELAALLQEEMGQAPMSLFKDPRICRLMPVWTRALESIGRDAVAVLPCRHPLEVAGSLSAKAGLTRPYALMMWLQHVVLGERFTRGMRRSFTDYEALLNDWRAVLDKVAGELGVVWPKDMMRAGVEIDAFLTGELRRQKPAERPLSADDLERLCERAWTVLPALQADPNDAAAQAELDAVAAEMDRVVGVAGPLIVSLQRDLDGARTTLERTLRDVEGMVDHHRAELETVVGNAQRDIANTEAVAEQRVADAHRRIAVAERAREVLRGRLDQKERDLNWAVGELKQRGERIGELDGELAVARVHLARLDAIENSTTWKLSTVLRRPFERAPGLRRLVRGTLKLGWWVGTFKLGRKLREREALLSGAAPAPLTVQPTPAPVAAAQAAPSAAPETATAKAAPHIAFLSGEPDTPGHVYRVARWADAARALGATTSIARLEELPARLADFHKADLVYIWRTAWDERLAPVIDHAKAAGVPVMFDIDDLLMEPDQAKSDVIDGIRSQKFAEAQIREHFTQVERTFRAADFCSAPTEMLAHRLRRHGQPAFVLPNGFDEDVLQRSRLAARRRRQEPADGLVRIGYATGSKTHQKDFAEAADAVARILFEHPEARLVLFRSKWGDVLDASEFPAFEGLMDQIEWRDMVPIAQLPDELARFDINLAPLEHGNIFCESKSELKFYEAALVDVPTIASPTGPYRKAIRHGETGYIAAAPDDWYAALKALVGDADLRKRIAQAAHYAVLPTYGPERRVELFASVLEQTIGTPRQGARAFELDVARRFRPPAVSPHVPSHRIVFESDQLEPAQVTVVVPLYNYANYITEALESAAAQTVPVDLVVIDDRSTDNSLEVARAWIEANAHRFGRAVLAQNDKNSGLAFTRNVGFAAADTMFVLPLDADNRLRPECAERLVAAAKENCAAFAYPRIEQFGDATGAFGAPYEPGRLVTANFIDAMALVRRAEWAGVGGYDHVQYGWEDYDLWCRFAETGRFGVFVDEPLAEYRVHGSSMLRSETDLIRNKLRLVNDIERRHPWLHIDRDPPTGPKLPDEEPPEAPAKRTAVASEERVGFIVGGVQKGGTTALFKYLEELPSVAMASVKETHFFDDDAEAWADPDYARYHAMFPAWDGRVRGEVTPSYLYWPNCLERIARYRPDMKLVFIFRDPVERAWSQWKMEYARGWETEPFARAIREGRARVDSDEASGHHRVFSYVERGFYAKQLKRVYEIFPKEQVLLLLSEDLKGRPGETLHRVCDFVGAAPPAGPIVERRELEAKEIDYGCRITDEDVAYLRGLYADDILEFAEISGLPVQDWAGR